MFELDGIVYGSQPTADLSVKEVEPLDDLIMLVTFSTGENAFLMGQLLLIFPYLFR